MNYFKKRKLSFQFAFNGIRAALREPNFRIQFIAALFVVMLAIIFHVNRYEWFALIGCCSMVLSLELINSAIENLCNLVTKEIDPTIKFIKDVSAGAVLVASVASIIIGVIVFYPYLRQLFS